MSKRMVRTLLRMVRITQPRSDQERVIYSTVEDLSRSLGIKMPEVWIYDAPDPNAFATGPSKNNAMVAVSTGLLRQLDERGVRVWISLGWSGSTSVGHSKPISAPVATATA